MKKHEIQPAAVYAFILSMKWLIPSTFCANNYYSIMYSLNLSSWLYNLVKFLISQQFLYVAHIRLPLYKLCHAQGVWMS